MNKNLFLFAAAAALTFTACSDNDDMTASRDGSLSSNETTAVQFSTYLAGQQTRAGYGGKTSLISNSELQSAGFGVFAYNTEKEEWKGATGNEATPNFMYNQKVEYKNNAWEYDPIKYWPNDFSENKVDEKQGLNGEENNATGSTASGKISFFAYAPWVDASSYTAKSSTLTYGDVTDNNAAIGTQADASNVATTGITGMTFNTYKGEPKVRYELGSTDYSKEVDLLWGLAGKTSYNLAAGDPQTVGTYNTNLTKQAVNEKIAFNFKHALAKLGGNTKTTSTETETDESKQHVKIVLDIDNGGWDASTAITGGTKGEATLVTVNSIKIRDYQTYAETEGGTKYTTTTTGNLRTKGWFNIATGEWDEPADGDVQKTGTTTVTYSSEITPNGGTGKTKLNATIAEPTEKPTYDFTNKKWSLDGVTTDAKGVYTTETGGTADNGILMIPDKKDVQTLVVTVNYTVRTADNHLSTVSGEKQGGTKIVQEITNAVNIPADALASNKVYTLLIHLGLTSVKFSAQVTDWEDATTPTTPSDPDDPDNNNSSENNKDIYLPSNTLAASTITKTDATMAATATTYEYDLSNLPAGAKIANVSVKKGSEDVAGATVELGTIAADGTAKATVKGLSANDSTTDPVTYTVTFDVTNSDGTVLQKITLTITQAAKSE